MTSIKRTIAAVLSTAALALLSIASVTANGPSGGGFDLSWNTLDSGGGTSAGESFELGGTIAQPDAGPAMTGGGFELVGGFWPGAGGPVVIPCPADINGDNDVNVIDLLTVISGWGACPPPPTACPADINGDGLVSVTDLLAVINAWGTCP